MRPCDAFTYPVCRLACKLRGKKQEPSLPNLVPVGPQFVPGCFQTYMSTRIYLRLKDGRPETFKGCGGDFRIHAFQLFITVKTSV